MSVGTVQINGQRLSTLETDDVCRSLQSNSIKCLSLRECTTNDKLYNKLIDALSGCKSILQLNFNLGLVKNVERVILLSHALYKNRSLTSLFLHGSAIGDKGMQVLCKVLALHPNIVALDIGDCQISDTSVPFITELFPPNGAKRGLQELTLSGNSSITPNGWVKFFIALAASNTLRKLYLDYNNLGELGVNCLAVAIASTKSLQVLDLEGAGVTEVSAQMLLHLVKNYPVTLTDIVLSENHIKKSTKDHIQLCLQENEEKRRMSTINSSIVAHAMESDFDTSTVSGIESLTASSVTLNSVVESEMTDTYASIGTGVLNSLQIEDDTSDDNEDDEYSVIKGSPHNIKSSQRENTFKSRPLPKLTPKSTLEMSNEATLTSTRTNFQDFNKANCSEIMSDSDDNDDMGTLLIGQTLPGYYANPVRIGVNPRGAAPGEYDRIRAQDAAMFAYADALT